MTPSTETQRILEIVIGGLRRVKDPRYIDVAYLLALGIEEEARCDGTVEPAAPAPAETTRECNHHFRVENFEFNKCILCGTLERINTYVETPGPQPVSEPQTACAHSGKSWSMDGDDKRWTCVYCCATGVSPSPVPTPPDAAQGKPHEPYLCKHGRPITEPCAECPPTVEKPTTTGESGLRECGWHGALTVAKWRAHPRSDNEIMGEWAEDNSTYIITVTHQLRDILIRAQHAAWNTRSTPRAMEGDDIGALIVRLRAEALADEKYMSEGCDHRDSDLWKAADFLARLTRHSTATQADGGTK